MPNDSKKQIRHDIYSLKEWDSAIGDWCHVAMSRSLEGIKRQAAMRAPSRRKFVHPAQWIVDGFTAYGNKIED